MSLPSPSQPPPDRAIESIDHVGSVVSSAEPLLSNADVRADPILTSLAKQQRGPTASTSTLSNHTFKARPAPSNMRENVGPRMTKAAALRQGLPWEEKSRARPSTAGDSRPLGTAAGHKRNNLSVVSHSHLEYLPRPLT
jgi:hypothetical protein